MTNEHSGAAQKPTRFSVFEATDKNTIAGIQHCTITRNGPDTELFTKEQVLACIAADRASRVYWRDFWKAAQDVVDFCDGPTEAKRPDVFNRLVRTLREALRTQSGISPAVPEWLPIESAPKDGTKLLGIVHFAGDDLCKPFCEYSLIWWDKGFKSSICDRKPQWEKQFRGDVTHYIPFPAPPSPLKKHV